MNKYYDYSISAIGVKVDEKKIKDALKKIGLEQVVVETLLNFDAYVESLPNKAIDGFTEACDNWARHYGMGGGDMSTETRIRQICEEDSSDNPQVLARAFYDAVADSVKTSFITAKLVAECIDTAFEETEAE